MTTVFDLMYEDKALTKLKYNKDYIKLLGYQAISHYLAKGMMITYPKGITAAKKLVPDWQHYRPTNPVCIVCEGKAYHLFPNTTEVHYSFNEDNYVPICPLCYIEQKRLRSKKFGWYIGNLSQSIDYYKKLEPFMVASTLLALHKNHDLNYNADDTFLLSEWDGKQLLPTGVERLEWFTYFNTARILLSTGSMKKTAKYIGHTARRTCVSVENVAEFLELPVTYRLPPAHSPLSDYGFKQLPALEWLIGKRDKKFNQDRYGTDWWFGSAKMKHVVFNTSEEYLKYN